MWRKRRGGPCKHCLAIHTHYIGVEFNRSLKGKEHDNATQICQASHYELKASISKQIDERGARAERSICASLSLSIDFNKSFAL